MLFMRDSDTGAVYKVKLHPGEYYATSGGSLITTTLDVFICVCLHDPKAGVSGMLHLTHPQPQGRLGPLVSDAGLYGTHSLKLLLKSLERRGASRDRLEASVYGGAHPGDFSHESVIAESCVSYALRFLRDASIDVIQRDIGGRHRRVIALHPSSGRIFVDTSTEIQWLDLQTLTIRLDSPDFDRAA